MWVHVAVVFTTALIMVKGQESQFSCPPLVCSCSESSKAANCSDRGLLKTPPGLPLNLKSLDLSKNELKTVNTTDILNITHLEILDLSYNKITELSFPGTHYKLRKLDISSNSLSTVRGLQLDGLVHLMELNLANNKIISLPSNAFPGGNLLRFLNLKNNRIVSLDEGCMDNLTSLEHLTFFFQMTNTKFAKKQFSALRI